MLNSAILGNHIDLFEEKSFQLYFKKNMQSILLYSMVFPRSGGGEGDTTFLLKCHALCPICLNFLVVHFYTYIYVSILNLWAAPTEWTIDLCIWRNSLVHSAGTSMYNSFIYGLTGLELYRKYWHDGAMTP